MPPTCSSRLPLAASHSAFSSAASLSVLIRLLTPCRLLPLLNNCCILSLVVFYWAESVHSSTYASEEFLPKLGVAFLITNAIMWAFQVRQRLASTLAAIPFREIVESSFLCIISAGDCGGAILVWCSHEGRQSRLRGQYSYRSTRLSHFARSAFNFLLTS